MVHLKTAESINDINFIKNDSSWRGVVFLITFKFVFDFSTFQ
mgnify:CR=1 FL=1